MRKSLYLDTHAPRYADPDALEILIAPNYATCALDPRAVSNFERERNPINGPEPATKIRIPNRNSQPCSTDPRVHIDAQHSKSGKTAVRLFSTGIIINITT